MCSPPLSISVENVEILKLFSQNSRCYVKDYCTNCLYSFSCIFQAESKYDNENLNSDFFFFKVEIWTCCLHSLLALRGLMG